MRSPGVQKRAHDIGASLVATDRRSPEYFTAFVRDEIEKWGKTIRAAGIAGTM